jgi:putative peptidoglycan lipid II flippase
MNTPGEHPRWSEEPTVVLNPVEAPTVPIPVVPSPNEAPTAGTTAAIDAEQVAQAAQAAETPGGDLSEDTGSVTRDSGNMAIASLVSRATGFLRALVVAAAVGGDIVGGDYAIANNLPNVVYQLLLDGVLASVLIPSLVRARKQEADRGQAYAQRLLTLAVIALGAATLIVVPSAPLFTALVTNDNTPEASRELLNILSYLLLPEIFFYGLAGIFAAILNTRGSFKAPMWAPILNNLVVIATCGLFALMRIGEGRLTLESITTPQALVLGTGTTLGIVLQSISLWPALRKVGFRWQWRFDFRALHLGELGRLSAWMLLYVAMNQIGVTVVLRIANLAGQKNAANYAAYNNAFLIFMMAHGIVAVSVITAIMPRMSSAAADGRLGEVAEQLSNATRLASVVLMPAAAMYVALGKPLGVMLFGWGEYSHQMAVETGWVITMAGLALVPYAISQLQTSAFYALRDTRTPSLLNVPVVGVRIAIDVVFYLALPAAIVTASLMLGTALSFLVALVPGYWLLRRKLGRLGLRQVADALVRLAIAAVVAAVPTFVIGWLIGTALGDGKISSILQVVIGGSVLVGVYAVVATLLKVREVSQFGRMIRRRIGR